MDNSNLKMIYFSDVFNLSLDLKSLHENVLQIDFLDVFKVIEKAQNIIMYPNFIENEREFKEEIRQNHQYDLNSLNLINPYKFFMCDQDLNMAIEDLNLIKGVHGEKTIFHDDVGNVFVVLHNDTIHYYNNAGEKVITVTNKNGKYFAECYIDNELYMLSSELQLMCLVMKILVERNDYNYVLYNNNILKFGESVAHVEKWNYDNFKLITHIDKSIFSTKDKKQYATVAIKELFTQNKNAVFVSDKIGFVSESEKINFLPKIITGNLDKNHPNNVKLVNMWTKWLSFENKEIEEEPIVKSKGLLGKRQLKVDRDNAKALDTVSDNIYYAEKIDLDKFTPMDDEISIVCDNVSILAEARFNSKLRSIIVRLTELDYVLYDNDLYTSKFVQRSLYIKRLQKALKKNEFIDNTILWTKSECATPRKIVVIFSSLPGPIASNGSNMLNRCFNKNYLQIGENIVEDTLIIRIADLNAVYGSYYTNTINYPNYHQDISKVLKSITDQYNLEKSDVTLYGIGKGGYGALLHGLRLGYNVLVADPIISMHYFNFDSNINYLQSLELAPRIDILKSMLKEKVEQRIYVIISSTGVTQVRENAQIVKKLYEINNGITIIDINTPNIKSHADVTAKTLNIQNSILNKLLLS